MTHLAMTKIVVRDLEFCATFYRAVCGFDTERRVEADGFAELILSRSDGAGSTLVLLADGTTPPPGEAVLVFETEDLAAFTTRAEAAGGKVTQPALSLASLGLSFAMYADPEGHVVEAIQRH